MITANLIHLTPELTSFVKTNQKQARKNAQTLLRLPREKEHGFPLDTWVEKNGMKVLETSTTIYAGGIIAKNPKALSDGSFNEYIFSKETFLQHYGEENYSKLTHEFQPFSKKLSCSVVKITPELKALLPTFIKNEKISFMATFNLEMVVDIGDYFVINQTLNCMDYGIDAEQFKHTYQFLD